MGGFGWTYDSLVECLGVHSSKIDDVEFFIETGTHRGQTVVNMSTYFPNVWSVELSESLYSDFKPIVDRMNTASNGLCNIQTFLGASEKVLPELCERANGKAIFYLDAHYCHGRTARGEKDCPMMDELAVINKRPWNDIIICDDVMYFNKVKLGLDWTEVKIDSIKKMFGDKYHYIEKADRLFIVPINNNDEE